VAVTDETGIPVGEDGEDDVPASLGTRVMGIFFAVVLLLIVGFAFLHVALKPIAGGVTAPKGHYPGPCWVCHTVTSTVEGSNGP
jgi:hypothetical protein